MVSNMFAPHHTFVKCRLRTVFPTQRHRATVEECLWWFYDNLMAMGKENVTVLSFATDSVEIIRLKLRRSSFELTV